MSEMQVDAVRVLEIVSERFARRHAQDQQEIAVRDVMIADLKSELTQVQRVDGDEMPKQGARE